EVRPIAIDRVAVAGLADAARRAVQRAKHFLRLVDPSAIPLRAGNAIAVVVAAPEDERLAILQAGLKVTAERFATAQVDDRRRAGVAGEVPRAAVLGVDPRCVVGMQPGDQPAVLSFRTERPVG